MEAEDLSLLYAALLGTVALFFSGVLFKASLNWLMWNSPVSTSFWGWMLGYKLDDILVLLFSALCAYLLLRWQRGELNASSTPPGI